jgi:hypothetical protein
VRVPVENRLAVAGAGFRSLVTNLPQERLSIGVAGLSAARAAYRWTPDDVRERHAFGQPIVAFQNTHFRLAEIHRDRCDRGLRRPLHPGPQRRGSDGRGGGHGQVLVHRAAGPRHRHRRPAPRRLRLHDQYPIARACADARVTPIYGRHTEIMKEIIGRSIRS